MKQFLMFSALCIMLNANSQIISQWRGDNRDGIYKESGLLTEWPENGPKLLMQLNDMGDGFSSPAVTPEFIYITGLFEDKGYVQAIGRDGKVAWKSLYGEEWSKNFNGARTTPTIDGENLYLFSGQGVAVCMNRMTGKIIWRVDVLQQYNGRNIQWGVTDAPLIKGDKIYLTVGGDSVFMVALNKKTGGLIWSNVGKGDKSAYCAPLLFTHNNQEFIAIHSESYLHIVDAIVGNIISSYKWENRWAVHPNTPIYTNGQLFIASGYGKGCAVLSLDKKGGIVAEVWSEKRFDPRTSGFVLIDGHIYGSGDQDKSWQCYNLATGTQTYTSLEIFKGVVIAAEGLLYCYSEKGDVALVKANPAKFEVISKFKLPITDLQQWAHPVIFDKKLYIRMKGSLYVYDIAK